MSSGIDPGSSAEPCPRFATETLTLATEVGHILDAAVGSYPTPIDARVSLRLYSGPWTYKKPRMSSGIDPGSSAEPCPRFATKILTLATEVGYFGRCGWMLPDPGRCSRELTIVCRSLVPIRSPG